MWESDPTSDTATGEAHPTLLSIMRTTLATATKSFAACRDGLGTHPDVLREYISYQNISLAIIL